MLNKIDFLRIVEERAGTKAAIARALNLPPPRITEMFKGERNLSYDEAVTLANVYGVGGVAHLNAEMLTPVLGLCLKHASAKTWTDQEVERLAKGIEYGLSLLQPVAPNRPSQDALDVAERAIAERFQNKLV